MSDITSLKHCAKCNETKPVTHFNLRKSTPDGLYSQCKKCRSQVDATYRAKNRDKINAKQRAASGARLKPDDRIEPSKLHGIFHYDAVSGNLLWKAHSRHNSVAGSFTDDGRFIIRIRNKKYRRSHVVFAMHNGRWPKEQIDHINRVRNDDRIENLREATHAENSRNKVHRKSPAGLKGVTIINRGRYLSSITLNKKTIRLGMFDTAQEAHEAYVRAAKELHGEFACTL